MDGRDERAQGLSVYALRTGAVVAGSALVMLGGAFLPSQVFLILPYPLAIVALVVVARKADYRRALLVPWFKGTR